MLLHGFDRDQALLFTSIGDFVSDDNYVRSIDFVVDYIVDEKLIEFEYKGNINDGRPAYPFSSLIKLYIYGYINRIKSSRALANECKRNLELIWLLRGLSPEFRTIAYFRKNYSSIISKFNKLFKKKLIELNLINTTVAIDGSKFKANANKDMISRKATLEQMKRINITMEQYLSTLDRIDQGESEESPEDLSKEELEHKISSLENKLQELNTYLSKMDSLGKNHLSTTDIDCNLMKSRDGFIPAYNVQLGVETKNHFIMGEYVSQSANDINELEPMIEEIFEETEIKELTSLTDAGYPDLDTIQRLESNENINCYSYLPPSQVDKNFQYDSERDVYICPMGKDLTRLDIKKRNPESHVIRYRCKECNDCPMKKECTSSEHGREINRFSNQEYRDNYRKRMSEKASQEKLSKRKSVVEHVFGNLKVTGGKIPLLLRGQSDVSTEIKLYVLGYNMKRLLTLFSYKELLQAFSQLKAKTAEKAQFINFLVLIMDNYRHKFAFMIS